MSIGALLGIGAGFLLGQLLAVVIINRIEERRLSAFLREHHSPARQQERADALRRIMDID